MKNDKLIDRRAQIGMTQAELAEKAKVDPSTVALLETGRRKPHRRTAYKIAGALACSPEEIGL